MTDERKSSNQSRYRTFFHTLLWYVQLYCIPLTVGTLIFTVINQISLGLLGVSGFLLLVGLLFFGERKW